MRCASQQALLTNTNTFLVFHVINRTDLLRRGAMRLKTASALCQAATFRRFAVLISLDWLE